MNKTSLQKEFSRQLENLINKGYPKAANISPDEFKKLASPLQKQIELSTYEIDLEKGTLPFAIVVSSKLVPIEYAMSHTEKSGKEGIVKLYPHEPKDFETISEVSIPEKSIYLILDIDRGKKNINLPPSEAFDLIRKENRSPLTIDEGVAILTHYPDFLIKNNCFSLLASRNKNDKRVPAIWINAKKAPNLGWCWEGNPHTWLGSASCAKRVH